MRLLRKWSIYLIMSAVLLTSVPINVHAAATLYSKANFEEDYNAQFDSFISQYLINAQPSGALLLNANSTIGTANISKNYDSGIVDLPRLQVGYYYGITEVGGTPISGNDDTYGLRVNRTLYPSLSWSSVIPHNTTIKLAVYDEDTSTVQKTCTITFTEEMQPLPPDFEDCSKGLLNTLLNSNSSKYNGSVNYYPVELHKDSIITSSYAVGFSDNFNGFRTNLMNNVGMAESVNLNSAQVFTGYLSESSRVSVKEAVWPYISGSNNGRPEMFAVFEPVGQGVSYDSNRGVVSSGTSLAANYSAEYRGVYCIATNTDLDWYIIKPEQYTGSLTTVSQTAPLMTLNNNEDYNIEENLGKYGFDRFLEANKNLFDSSNYPTIKYTGGTDNTMNVYQTALAFGGIIPNIATFKGLKPVDQFTITTWYTRPNETQLKKCEEHTVNIGGVAPTLAAPSDYVSLYTFDTWYSDQACTKKVDMSKIMANAKPNDVVNLYGKYNYTGGKYTVQFYNDYTNETSSVEYECREQPTLPDTPTRPGYLFRNWQMVYTTSSSSGTVYDPATFQPQSGVKYMFKTFWDVQGVITAVTPSQTEYYVGDYIDKSKISVTVQTDNAGTIRQLNTDEFTVSPDKMESSGKQQFQITYNATGATATVNLTGKAVTPVSISAKYTGSDLTVGSVINKNNIVVTVNYNNQTTEEISEFTITPSTVTTAGGNTIRVIYGSLSTTVSVNGIKKETSGSGLGTGGSGLGSGTNKPGTGTGTGTRPGAGSGSGSGSSGGSGSNQSQNQTLKTITAYYKGAQPYVGDSIKANDITVTAEYTDGSSTALNSTAFQYSPSFIRNSGSNTIVVTYGGKQTSFTVEALAQTETTTTTGNSGTNSVTGVDEQGNPIYNSGSSTGSSSQPVLNGGSGTTQLQQLGNPLTGAGVSSGDKGTSVGYLNGSNILTSRLYGGTTAVTNSLDILGEIRAAGDSATSVTVELYNGAAGNDITQEMLEELKDKELTLNINMLNPDSKTTIVAKWIIVGELLVNTDAQFSPNVSFEVTDKGSDILTYMAVLDGTYPDNTQLTVYPATSTYASGELIRMYSCGFDKSNAHLEKSFTWSDGQNEIAFDIANSTRYCLSNALAAYPEGSSLTENIDLPSLEDEVVDDTVTEEPITEEDDWSWDEELIPEEPIDNKKGLPVIPIVAGVGVLSLAGAGVFILTKLRKGSKVNDYEEASDEYEDEDMDYPEDEYADDDYVSEEMEEDLPPSDEL